VWLPVAATLALSGRIGDALIVVGVGCFAGISDNFLRPALSRFGRLRIPMFALFCSMLGGITAFGAAGLIVGPLFVRLAMEGLRLWRDRSAQTSLVAFDGAPSAHAS
jgi:predicted PurR-regulated permease PerM